MRNIKQPHWPDLKNRQQLYTPLIPGATLVCHRIHAVMVHSLNPSTRDYKTGGDGSHSQPHSGIPGGRIAIFGLRSK